MFVCLAGRAKGKKRGKTLFSDSLKLLLEKAGPTASQGQPQWTEARVMCNFSASYQFQCGCTSKSLRLDFLLKDFSLIDSLGLI